jgi:glycosyltransferase involved in cell wall biosynthesis
MRKLSILHVAYPLLGVSEESAGGAEQVLLTVASEMAAAGHRTTIAAANGSRVPGELLATGEPVSAPDQYEKREREHNERVLAYLRRHPREFDLIHDQSGSFFRVAGGCPVPVLATLHLPRSFYRQELFEATAPNGFFNCVSEAQAFSFRDLPNLLGIVENGIALERFPFAREKGDYVLWLGRICEEKGPHLAIAAAQSSGVSLVIAGQIYPFSYHQQYFEREIRPRLSNKVRFVDTPLAAQKLKLLRNARALLLTSTAEETSSLVGMEAMACGTPVVAFRRGAFPEVVADGETGFVVDTIEEMGAALKRVGEISPEACRARVERDFSASRMAQEYEELYKRVLSAGSRAVAS